MSTESRLVVFDTDVVLDDMIRRGWLAADLASAAQVSPMTVSRFLRGGGTVRTAKKIADAFGVDVDRYVATPGSLLTATQSKKLRQRAHAVVKSAVRDGTLVRQACAVCGAARTEAHHDDYWQPLAVIWLCHTHHMARHAQMSGLDPNQNPWSVLGGMGGRKTSAAKTAAARMNARKPRPNRRKAVK